MELQKGPQMLFLLMKNYNYTMFMLTMNNLTLMVPPLLMAMIVTVYMSAFSAAGFSLEREN